MYDPGRSNSLYIVTRGEAELLYDVSAIAVLDDNTKH